MNQTNQTMRVLALSVLAFCAVTPLFSQEDCDVFNIQQLAADYLSFGVDTVILQPDGSFEVQLSNGTTFVQVQGCTDPAYVEYDATANTDDGSCATLPCTGPTMDGYTYSVVEIGDQCWFAENLRTSLYADDSAIPEVTGNSAWTGLSTGARSDYGNNGANVATTGRLYNWYAVDHASGLCPSGWHVPSHDEWTALENYVGANGHSGAEGTAVKATSGWNGDGNGTDDFGFSALPGGDRKSDYGNFNGLGNYGRWWSSTPVSGDAWSRSLSGVYPDIFQDDDFDLKSGFSVRCIEDAD